jgi:hypothetical protein
MEDSTTTPVLKHLHVIAGPKHTNGSFRRRYYFPPEESRQVIDIIAKDFYYLREEDTLNIWLDVYAEKRKDRRRKGVRSGSLLM